ncbi:outer membrane receptor protein involved in Fe transport [Rhodothalassium salexigens DSM 2132]|uniref:Outer membrane receptor protein involved in Fe transport n=1 Tax=Rhodothalassium salexigens DSM 2132 TaxID=1188247 RepID=A0A4R2PRA2_RHOSA|nr:TonB-dependent receptor [Rhodothalassium salexigens]MBK1638551.1 hypothetical protein [Rhodothalassium salexigens DSM 2132]TCP38349.1 outer membrane receptor protein involved in Fe transport [Rhodothalassium salexigens DSM 2132]
MVRKSTVSVAALAALTGTFGSTAAYGQVEEIVVTATKRVQTTQDAPVTVTALGSAQLEDLRISNFTDYLQQLPNVTAQGRGPGQQLITVRGLGSSAFPVYLSGANGKTPNVALYLDEQPVTMPGRNLDVYATDLERIEVLPGPQGTLFGASSQAGTVRLITKKPVMNQWQAGFSATVSTTKDGEMSNKQEAYINAPVVEDKLAFRLALFNDSQGGYIDNVAGTKTLDPSVNPRFNPGRTGFQAGADLSDVEFLEASNTEYVEDDFNDALYRGLRLSGKWFITDQWDLEVVHMRQNLDADGVFDYDPAVGDLDVQRFSSDELNEKWHNTAWTLTGRLNFLEVVYTGGYLDRNVDQVVDYTGYANVGPYIPYYICDLAVTYPDAGVDPSGTCQAPNLGAQNLQDITKNTHELRFNTPDEYRLKATFGVFYDDLKLKDRGNFQYFGSQFVLDKEGRRGFAQNAPLPGATTIDPNPRDPGVAFFNDITRTEEQIAVFGEATFEVVPGLWDVTFGARWFDIDVSLVGSSNFAFGNLAGDGGDSDSGNNLDETLAGFRPAEEKDVIFKAGTTFTPTEDLLFFFTWSQGFRPGGLNRGCAPGSTTNTVPCAFETDELTNYELGWKIDLFDRNVRFNGAAFFMKWDNIQASVFAPEVVGSNLTFNDNAADAEIWGLEGDLTWAVTTGLTVSSAFTYLNTELTDLAETGSIAIAPVGSELSTAPDFQGNIRARYTWFMGDYQLHAQTQVNYSSSAFSDIVLAERRKMDDYATWNLSAGIRKDRWRAELFAQNLTDTRAELFISTQDDIPRIFTNRPRTWGLRVGYDF